MGGDRQCVFGIPEYLNHLPKRQDGRSGVARVMGGREPLPLT